MKKMKGKWWNMAEHCWVECSGYKVSPPEYDDFEFMVHKGLYGSWTVTEQSSGCRCGPYLSTRYDAILAAFRNLSQVDADGLRKRIEQGMRIAGVVK